MGRTDNMTAKQKLDYYLEKSYQDARDAHANGKLVCWTASIAPTEFCEVMDICMVFPENHAAAIGAKKGALDMIEIAERRGYSGDNCSYSRINLAYMDLLVEEAKTGVTPEALANCPGPKMPLPDLILICNNICNTLLKWYENIAVELNVPYIIIDTPYNHTMPVPQYTKDYIVDQFKYAIEQLEEVCQKPFDYEKFVKVQEQTQRTIAAWDRAMGMAAVVPSPLNGFDMFNYMALIVCTKSKYDAEDTFNTLADELAAKAARGEDAFKGGEKFRFAWEGIACWPYLGHTYKALKKLGMNMVGSTYPGTWSIHYEVGDLYQMAESYAKTYSNTCLSNKANVIADVLTSTHCDGITYHLNRSCKLMSFLNAEGAELVREKTGLPYVSFDGDQTDPRNFSEAQFDTRIQALSEIMESNK
jgi:benzoyl-CoA reductase/2-hydroxyglutaryl-CoA dehydratase subunit BcrC/BadD/HgdB